MEAGAHRQKVARPGVAEEQEDLGGEIEVCGPGSSSTSQRRGAMAHHNAQANREKHSAVWRSVTTISEFVATGEYAGPIRRLCDAHHL